MIYAEKGIMGNSLLQTHRQQNAAVNQLTAWSDFLLGRQKPNTNKNHQVNVCERTSF